MKRVSLLLAIFLLGATFSFATVSFLTVDWSNTQAGNTGNPSCGTYNWATSHFLVCDYAALAVRIASGTDGALLGTTLSTTGVNLGTYGVFGICATSDGVIYGATDIKSDGATAGTSLIRWANEGAAPTQQDPAESIGVAMEFPRALDAIGTGADTIIGVTGSDDYKVTFLTTADGTTFAITDSTPVGGADGTNATRIKQGVALVPGMEKVYGTKADGSGEVVRLDKVGGSWVQHTGFEPPYSYGDPPDGLGAAGSIGFAPGNNAIFVLGFGDFSDNDYITVLDGDTGAILVQLQSGMNFANNGYGAIDLDETSGVGYFIVRSGTANSHACGKISFDPYTEPEVPACGKYLTNWGLYE